MAKKMPEAFKKKKYFFVFCGIFFSLLIAMSAGAWVTYKDAVAAREASDRQSERVVLPEGTFRDGKGPVGKGAEKNDQTARVEQRLRSANPPPR